jgi:glycerol-3-phosphate acyltransferase PlsX
MTAGPVRIAVDAMGGDYAPGEVVAGVVAAVREGGLQVGLVGDPEAVGAELARHDAGGLPIMVVPSEGVIEEGEQAALALRRKPRASILVATGLVKKGMADGCVTMGSTGAAMAAAAVILGMLEGIDRPALGGPVIGLAPRTAVIDVGTNLDCRPAQLLNFAVLGSVFASLFWDIEVPRIALLSVGGEVGKGNRQVREASELFERTLPNFIGNIEANELPTGKTDVAVADGFVGNIVMKLTEGLGAGIADLVAERLKGRLPDDQVQELAREIYEVNNLAEVHGGGPLLGVRGISVVGHGRGKADAVRRAIGTARRSVEGDLAAMQAAQLQKIRDAAPESA